MPTCVIWEVQASLKHALFYTGLCEKWNDENIFL